MSFRKELELILSRRKGEDILAEFLTGCLTAFDKVALAREDAYGQINTESYRTGNSGLDIALLKKHSCEGVYPVKLYGPAITYCYEEADGRFWAGNNEYETQVNYCPYCGIKAPLQAPITKKLERSK